MATKQVSIIEEITDVYRTVIVEVPEDMTDDQIKEAYEDCSPSVNPIDIKDDFDCAKHFIIAIENNGE